MMLRTQDFFRPFKRLGILPVGGRSTAIKLKSGDVWVLASTTLDPPTKSKIDEMGRVRYIIAPDTEHSMYICTYFYVYFRDHILSGASMVINVISS